MSRGILSWGDFVLGGILSRGILSGGFCPGGFCPGGFCPDTAYNTFTELYTPLVNTLTYIAEHSSEFTSDTVKKASSFLDGITEFQFIATLIIAKHILSTTQILSKSLQYRNAQDIVRGWNHVKITRKRVKEIRQDVDKHHATWFSESTVVAEKVGEEPRIPRRCARQIQRNNVPATTPSEYYK